MRAYLLLVFYRDFTRQLAADLLFDGVTELDAAVALHISLNSIIRTN